ncbi:hypothetical protein LNA22_004649 [Salmonella enterica subsp. enterica serovar Bovismorbificans]|nr:hypothetical protein [Salmonella enterica subsp. enterica serovar Bovismorbificans]EIM4514586.1 hypothetical protein [Salmonella enterica subsp. enterica serovar Bovismorbificans]
MKRLSYLKRRLLLKVQLFVNGKVKNWLCGERVQRIVGEGDWYTEIVVSPNGGLINVAIRDVLVKIGREGGLLFESETTKVVAKQLKEGRVIFNVTAQKYYDNLFECQRALDRMTREMRRMHITEITIGV